MSTRHTRRIAAVVPADRVDAARRLSWALGHAAGPAADFRIPLADASAPGVATHHAFAATASDAFVARLAAGEVGDDVPWDAFGLDAATAADALMALEFESAPRGAPSPLGPLMARLGLVRQEVVAA